MALEWIKLSAVVQLDYKETEICPSWVLSVTLLNQNQHKGLLVSVKALHTTLWIHFCEVLNVSCSCQSPLGFTLLSCDTGILLRFGLLSLLRSFTGSLLKFSNPAISKMGNYCSCALSGEECRKCNSQTLYKYRHIFFSVVKHDKFIIQFARAE